MRPSWLTRSWYQAGNLKVRGLIPWQWGSDPGTFRQHLTPGCLKNHQKYSQPQCAFNEKNCKAYFKLISCLKKIKHLVTLLWFVIKYWIVDLAFLETEIFRCTSLNLYSGFSIPFLFTWLLYLDKVRFFHFFVQNYQFEFMKWKQSNFQGKGLLLWKANEIFLACVIDKKLHEKFLKFVGTMFNKWN